MYSSLVDVCAVLIVHDMIYSHVFLGHTPLIEVDCFIKYFRYLLNFPFDQIHVFNPNIVLCVIIVIDYSVEIKRLCQSCNFRRD